MILKSGILKRISNPVFIKILIAIIAFVTGMIINRSIGIELRGKYATILGYSNYIQMFLNMGIAFSYTSLIQKYGKKSAKEYIMFLIWFQTVICLVITFVIFCLPFSSMINYIAMISVSEICNSQISFIAVIENIKKRNTILLCSATVFLFIYILAYILANKRLDVVVYILLAKNVFEVVLITKTNGFLCKRLPKINKEVVLLVLGIGIPTSFLNLMIACNYNLDILMLNILHSADLQLGIYGVAYSLSNMLWVIPDAFKEMVYHKTACDDDYKYILKSIIINICISLCICIGFIICGKVFLKVVYGDEFVIAYKVTCVLLCGIIPMISFKLIHPLYVNRGKAFIVIGLLVIAVLSNIIASTILIPTYGALGAAIASVISYFICGALFFVRFYIDYVRKYEKEDSILV